MAVEVEQESDDDYIDGEISDDEIIDEAELVDEDRGQDPYFDYEEGCGMPGGMSDENVEQGNVEMSKVPYGPTELCQEQIDNIDKNLY
jgi:hypothetical protein